MNNLIIASNRLPFRIEKKEDRHEIKQSSGGLVSALQSVSASEVKMIWVGVADFKKESWNIAKDRLIESTYKLEPLFVDRKKYQHYYDGFSNALLWPLFHYFPSFAEYDEESYKSYKEINELFAERICEIAQTGDSVWVHDYHLMLLPKYLKAKRPDLNVGFFLHIPFPSYEIYKLLPEEWRNEILDGIISSDVVGFHTPEYVSHFKRSLAYFSGITVNNDIAQVKEHRCVIRAYPISIDFSKFSDAHSWPAIARGRNVIKQANKNTSIIFSVDRLDYTKGVINRLYAYESLLESQPEYRGKVIFVINVVPSRDQISKYAERKKLIEENVARINGLYGNINWQPVIYQYRHLSFNQLLSFYTAADVALVTPMRDGMNLVAKEFVASRKDCKGVLILSEFAGASAELHDAILVNPNDTQTLKHGIIKALSLSSEEQTERMSEMRKIVAENNVHKWVNSFLNDLRLNGVNKTQPHIMSFEEKVELFDKYRAAKKRLLLLDYDGTLVPFYATPDEAVPGNELKQTLVELNRHEKNSVVIVSGRDAKTLEKWFGDLKLSIVAEHGALYKKNGSESWTKFITFPVDWKDEIKRVLGKVTEKYDGAFMEEKNYSLALHYRLVNPSSAQDLVASVAKELMQLDTYKFNVLYGNMVIEVKSLEVNKGRIASEIMNDEEYDFVLAIGDDVTDEDMFSALSKKEHCYTIKVGVTPTGANCSLISVNNVISLLYQLSQQQSTYVFNKTRLV